MSNLALAAQAAIVATPFTVTSAIAVAAKWLGPTRVVRLAADVERAAPEVEAVVHEAEKVPAVEHIVEDVEAKAKAEAERLNAATHGAIDAVAGELARVLPDAVAAAVVAAHATVEAQPAVSAPVEPAAVADVPEAPAPAEPVEETAPTVPAAGAPIVTSTKGSAPA